MFEIDDSENFDFETIAEAHSKSLMAVHLRFKAVSEDLRMKLDIAMKRTCAELYTEGFGTSVLVDICNYRNFTLHPYAAGASKLKKWEDFNPPVHLTNNIITALPISDESMVLNKLEIFRVLYNEQFVYRVSILFFSGNEDSRIKEISRHIVSNADIPGVTLLSMEVTGECPFNEIEELIPDNSSTSYSPFSIPVEPPRKTADKGALLTIDDILDGSFVSAPLPHIVNSSDGHKEGYRFILKGDVHVEFSTITKVTEAIAAPFIFSLTQEESNPTWFLTQDDEGVHNVIATIVSPVVKDMDDWERSVMQFPYCPFWGIERDVSLTMPLALSVIGNIAEWLESGLIISVDFDERGEVVYLVHVNEECDGVVSEVLCCVGSLSVIKSFLNLVKDQNPENTPVEELIFIAQGCGGDPYEAEEDNVRRVH